MLGGLELTCDYSLRIEVADFDFEEEEAPEMSFYDRLHSSLEQYWSALKRRGDPESNYRNITSDWRSARFSLQVKIMKFCIFVSVACDIAMSSYRCLFSKLYYVFTACTVLRNTVWSFNLVETLNANRSSHWPLSTVSSWSILNAIGTEERHDFRIASKRSSVASVRLRGNVIWMDRLNGWKCHDIYTVKCHVFVFRIKIM